MTADVLAAGLAKHGLQAGEQESKRLLFDLVLRAFRERSANEPTHASWVPGRIEVFGKHTDYCGGHTLVAPVPRGFAMVARPRADGAIRIVDARRRVEVTLDSHGPSPAQRADTALSAPAFTGWRNYAHVVVRRLARNFPGAPLAADVVFASDLPSASGMSSSSALMVGLGSTLVALAGIRERPEWSGNIQGLQDEAGYYACIENGLSFGSLAGDAGVGTHGGSEDHIAILCGAPGQLSAWTFVPIRHLATVPLPDDWTFVIAASGVAADKTGDAKESYNRLSREARTMLDLWNRYETPQPSLRAALMSDDTAPARLRWLVRSSEEAGAGAALERRLTHFLHEDARVSQVLEAVRTADRRRLTVLSDESQADAEMLLRNQVPETIALARAARTLGAFGASSFGAGFGGSVWAVIERDAAPAFAERWLSDFSRRFPTRTSAMTFIADPGPPLTLLVRET